MSVQISSLVCKGLLGLAGVGVALLTGCGQGVLAGPSDSPAVRVNGRVHGGAYPIQGATIRLMETQSNGVWNTATNSYKGTAKQLLQTTSDTNGYFTFPDTGWTCDAGQYAYVTVTGGHTAAATNNNVIQIGVIGGCSTDLANKTEIDNVNVFLSEPSTVAAAYALGNFISIDNTNAASGQQIVNITAPAANNSLTPGCTGSGYQTTTPLTCVHAGLANAFANAYNLVDSVSYGANQFPTGVARTTVPNNSHGKVPREMINTLGNIMQSCVDSGGGSVGTYGTYTPGGTGSTRCGDFFYWATPPGQTTSPTNTLQAVLNIAQYPMNNVDALFRLQPRAVFFTPAMSSDVLSSSMQNMAYTLSIFYSGTDLAGDTGLPRPADVAIDELDNAYVLYGGGTGSAKYGAVTEFGPDGTGIFVGAAQSNLAIPGSIALDSNGAAFVTNDAATNGNLYKINTPSTGGVAGAIGQTMTVPGGYAAGVALDMANNVWVVRDYQDLGQSLFRFTQGNGYQSTFFLFTPTLSFPSKRVFVDVRQNVLGVSSNTDPLGVLLNASSTQVYQYAYASNGFLTQMRYAVLATTGGYGLAVSNSDVAYVPITQQLDTETGTAGSPVANGAGSWTGTSSTGATYKTPMGVAMDGAGNVIWTEYASTGQIFKFVPSTAGSVSSGSMWSFTPCDSQGGVCNTASAAYLRGMALDSSGAMWCLANSSNGAVIQTLGYAAPTYPLLSYAHGGVIIQ